MARKKKLPTKVVNYDALNDELKRVYNKFSDEFAHKNIYLLREEAVKLDVESPTTLSKDDLVKRMTDKLLWAYFPLEIKNDTQPWELFRDGRTGERARGLFENYDGQYRIGNILVPAALAGENLLRNGDLIEGCVATISGERTLTIVNSIDGEAPGKSRQWFNEIPVGESRHFDSLILGTEAGALMPDLQMGERVILRDLSRETAKKILESFPHSIGLFLGVEPESEKDLKSYGFVSNFEDSKAKLLRTTYLALERAKRLCEWGKDVVLIVQGFDMLGDRDAERALFGAGRCFDQGSVTVIADIDSDKKIYDKIATRILD